MTSREFLGKIKESRLTGKEFLHLLGNTRISTADFNEIRDSQNLTTERLIQILDNSVLDEHDFAVILEQAAKFSKMKFELPGSLQRAYDEPMKKRQGLEHHAPVLHTPTPEEISQTSRGFADKRKLPENETGDISFDTSSINVTPADKRKNAFENYKQEEARDNSTLRKAAKKPRRLSRDDNPYESDDVDYDDPPRELNLIYTIISVVVGLSMVLAVFVMNIDVATTSFRDGAKPRKAITYTQPATRESYAEAIRGFSLERDTTGVTAGRFVTQKQPQQQTLTDFVQTSKYIFNATDKKSLRVYAPLSADVNLIAQETFADGLYGVLLLKDRLFAVSGGKYADFYEEQSGETATDRDSAVAVNYERDFTSVRVYDAVDFALIYELSIDGSFNNLLSGNDTAYIVTDFRAVTLQFPFIEKTYIPSISRDGGARLPLTHSEMFLPYGTDNASVTVTAKLADEPRVFGVTGGKTANACVSNEKILLLQHSKSGTTLVPIDTADMTASLSTDFDGDIIAADFSDNVYRAATSHTLYILDNELDIKGEAVAIAGAEDVKAVLLCESQVYFVGNALYIFDTAELGEPLPTTIQNEAVYSVKGAAFGPSRFIESTGDRIGVFRKDTDGLKEENAVKASLFDGDADYLVTSVAEKTPQALYADFGTGLVVAPFSYNDGFSNVTAIAAYKYVENGGFIPLGLQKFYDYPDVDTVRTAVFGGLTYTFIGDRVAVGVVAVTEWKPYE
ncbi:MAG: beta-propeller domain-containing protein [Oscillospiraceae bacterium]|jgi:hypothetical protein|nr:beta-propeller domain-containing protein [Oscillospiraceae bacterium]